MHILFTVASSGLLLACCVFLMPWRFVIQSLGPLLVIEAPLESLCRLDQDETT